MSQNGEGNVRKKKGGEDVSTNILETPEGEKKGEGIFL